MNSQDIPVNRSHMRSYFEEIDHLMFGALDLERACDEWRQLGFIVGPATSMEHMGFGNRRVLLRQVTPFAANFLEVVKFLRPAEAMHPILRHLNPRLEHGEQGANALIYGTRSADEAQAYYSDIAANDPASGLEPLPVMVGDYPSEGPDGKSLQVRFRNCLLPKLQMPVPVSLSQIQSWDFYQNEAWLQHPNAARSIVGVTVISDTLAADLARYEWLLGRKATFAAPEVAELSAGNVRLSFMTPTAFEQYFGVAAACRKLPFIAAMTISSDSFKVTRRHLSGASLPTQIQGRRLVVGPLVENAVVLEFVE